jgi:hypothetical protein
MAQKKTTTDPATGRVLLVLDGQAQNNDATKTG